MFPDTAPAWLWCAAVVVAGVYVGMFLLARRPVTLRLRRLGAGALVVFGVRLTLIPLGDALETPADLGLTRLVLIGGGGFWLAGRVWLARAEAPVLREQIQTACRGLFLECAEPRVGLFVFTVRGCTWRLRMTALSRRLQLVVLPSVAGPAKVSLLLHWLSRQYPGPMPRLHIMLKKE